MPNVISRGARFHKIYGPPFWSVFEWPELKTGKNAYPTMYVFAAEVAKAGSVSRQRVGTEFGIA